MKTIFGATDVGLVRTSNQDTFMLESVSDELKFAVLCDGMGGENGGNVASSLAAEFAFAAMKRDFGGGLVTGHGNVELSVRSTLMTAVLGANAVVYEASQKDAALDGMGTTMILAVLHAEELYVCYVGDSRVYLASKESSRQLTRDHTVVQMLIDMGEITPEEAKTHPKRHFITRAVGVGPDVEADFIAETLSPGETVLLCSDGLSGYLQTEELYGLLLPCLKENSAHPLIEYAKKAGGADNITAVVFGDCLEDE
jgi:protein phosphatase